MTEARRIVEEYYRDHTYLVRQFPSRSVAGAVWETRIYWGGSIDRPNASCTCQRWKFERECDHIDRLWNDEMKPIQRTLVVNHYRMYERLGIKHKA